MCYTVSALTQKAIKYATHRGVPQKDIKKLEEDIKELQIEIPELYAGEGFAHPKLMVFTDKDPFLPQAFLWGLIPGWCKNKQDALKYWNQTLNARGESIFEKPSFRSSAKNKRCLIVVDSFFEYHHKNGKTYPFNIHMKDHSPITLGGLWEEWVDKETGEVWQTCTIVTTEGNSMMAGIHNNPKLKGPRMPLILPGEIQNKWLKDVQGKEDVEALKKIIQPFDKEKLEAYTVPKIKGKEGVGNSREAVSAFKYEELLP